MVQEAHVQPARPLRRRVRHAGFLLGVGLAVLLDAALFHQILGWHQFLQESPANPAEGIFQAAGIAAVLVAVLFLWQARGRLGEPASGHVLLGAALLGAAAFNLAEGIVAHHVLGLHHVNPGGNVFAWDAGFLLANAVVALLAWRLIALAARIRETGSRRPGARRATGRIP